MFKREKKPANLRKQEKGDADLADTTKPADQRSLYTKSLIKGAFLELLKTHSFTSISVTMLSEQAGVGRNTFYRHFNNTFEVLEDAIDDAIVEMMALFRYAGISTNDSLDSYLVPFCEYIRNSDRYRVVFTDVDLESVIIERFLTVEHRRFIWTLQAQGERTAKQAEAIARFQVAGLLEICRAYATSSDEEWTSILSALEETRA